MAQQGIIVAVVMFCGVHIAMVKDARVPIVLHLQRAQLGTLKFCLAISLSGQADTLDVLLDEVDTSWARKERLFPLGDGSGVASGCTSRSGSFSSLFQMLLDRLILIVISEI